LPQRDAPVSRGGHRKKPPRPGAQRGGGRARAGLRPLRLLGLLRLERRNVVLRRPDHAPDAAAGARGTGDPPRGLQDPRRLQRLGGAKPRAGRADAEGLRVRGAALVRHDRVHAHQHPPPGVLAGPARDERRPVRAPLPRLRPRHRPPPGPRQGGGRVRQRRAPDGGVRGRRGAGGGRGVVRHG